MGQAISNVIGSFENQPEKEKQANDALNALLEMARLQVEAFRLAIRSVTAPRRNPTSIES